MITLTEPSWQELEMRVLSHLTELDESLKDWERYQRYSLEDLRKDRDKRNMTLHAMLVSIQVAIDISTHLISKNQLKRPATYREAFYLLGQSGMIPEELANELSDLAGFRNVLDHAFMVREITSSIWKYRKIYKIVTLVCLLQRKLFLFVFLKLIQYVCRIYQSRFRASPV